MTSRVFSIGDKIQNRYLVTDIFKGGMGKVYLVNDLEHDDQKGVPPQRIAKTIIPSLQDSNLYARFLEEASIWIHISKGKNAVYAYSVESIDGVPYVFAEYIRRGVLPRSLADWVHFRLLPVEVALNFTVQLLDGLWYAYQNNVEYHGDLKPSNILLNEDVELKINDWGWAHASNTQVSATESECFVRYHRSPYVAPELLLPTPRLTRGMDGYAIGVLLGEMLTGKQFPAGSSENGIESEIGRKNFCLNASIVKSLSRIIAELIAFESKKRDDFYANYGREISEMFMDISGISVLDESDSIIATSNPLGHTERVESSTNVLNELRKSGSPKKGGVE
jgi:serine/threonine protein kinase